MTRKRRSVLELVSAIGSLGLELPHYSDEEIAAAVSFLRTVNAPLLDFLVGVLAARPRVRCAICSRDVPDSNGGVVEPAHVWICNECLRNRVCP